MGRNELTGIISISGICSILSVVLQLAPVYFPVLGMAISPLSSLPIIIAVQNSKLYGSLSYFCSGILILFLSPHESAIFMLTTGIFGLILGLTYNKNTIISLTVTGLSLFSGINMLTFLLGIKAFGNLFVNLPIYIVLTVTLIFSFVYSLVWTVIVRIIHNRFKGINIKK